MNDRELVTLLADASAELAELAARADALLERVRPALAANDSPEQRLRCGAFLGRAADRFYDTVFELVQSLHRVDLLDWLRG